MDTRGPSLSREVVVIYIFAAGFLIQCFFWVAFAVGYRRSRRPVVHMPETGSKQTPISVVVAARNEEERIPDLIALLDAQSHEEFEVVVVDDASEDGTVEIIEAMAQSRSWLRLIQIEKPVFPRKKSALMAGIAAAKFDVLAFTDADCRPPVKWLSRLADIHASHGEPVVVVGHALFDKESGFLNLMARYVALITSFQAAATIGLGMPFMAFGTNLSYRKQLFYSVGGFGDGLSSLSGDDDLFVQHVHATGAEKIVWMSDRKAVVRTRAMTSVRTWLVQKKRHSSSARYFTWPVKIAGLIYWLSLTTVLLSSLFVGLLGVAISVRWLIIHTFCIVNAFCHFEAKDLIPRIPALATLYAAYNATMPVVGIFKPSKRWK